MKTRWALRFLFFLVGSYLAVGMVLRTEWAAKRICAQGASVASRLLGQTLVLSECRFDPWRTEIAIRGIRLGEDGGLFSARGLEVRFSLLSVLGGHTVSRVALDSPRLVIRLDGDAGEKRESAPPPAGGCLDVLESLPVGEAVLKNASIAIHLPQGHLVQLGAVDLEARSEGEARRARLSIGEGAFVPAGGEPFALEGASAHLVVWPAEDRAEIESLELRGLGTVISLRGSIQNVCAPRLALRGELQAELAELAERFLPGVRNVGGRAALSASVLGPLGDLRSSAVLRLASVTIADMEPGDLSARLELGGGRLEIHELVWPVGEGRAVIDGEIELASSLPARLVVRTEALPFHRMLARLPVKNTPVIMTIDSRHELEGKLLGGLSLSGRSSLRLHGFAVRNRPWHSESGTVIVEVPGTASLEGRVRITDDGVHFGPATASFGQQTRMEIDARLAFEDAKGLNIAVRAPVFDLDDVAGHVANIPIAGAGVIEATIRGPYPDPVIEGTFDFDGARLFSAALGRVRSRALGRPSEESVKFSDIEGELGSTRYRGRVDLFLGEDRIEGESQVEAGGRLAEIFGATRELLQPIDWLYRHLDGRTESIRASFRGQLPRISAEGVVAARHVRFLDRPFDWLEAQLVVPDITRLEVQDLRLTRGAGEARASGEVRFPGGETPSVLASMEAGGMPIRDLLGEFGEWAELRGAVAARATLQGPIDALDLRGELRGTGLAARGVKLADTHLSLETQGEQVIVRGGFLGAGALSAAVRLAEDLPFDASLLLEIPDLSAFLPASTRLGGELRGQAIASGFLSDVAASSGSVVLDELVLSVGSYRVASRGEVSLNFSGPAFVLHGLDLEGENTAFSLHGHRSIDGALDFDAQGTFDARLVGTFLPDLEHPSGVVSMKASITGPSERALVVGSAEIAGASFRVRDLPLGIQALDARLAFSQNQLVVQEATMIANGGRARMYGTVSLKGLSPDVLDLVFTASGMSWRMPAEWPVVASGRLGITGRWDERITLSGEATIDRLRWLQDLDIEKMMLDFRRRVEASTPTDAREWVRFDIDLLGGDDMRVDTEHLRARLRFVGGTGRDRGRLRLVGTNVSPALLGSVEILEGTALFRGNEYRVTNGMVDFRNRDRIDPVFDVTAETEVRSIRITAHAYGRLENFQVDLRSEPMLAQADILTLLTFGITSQDLDSGGGTAFSGASLAADALLTVTGFDEHVKRWLPQTPLLMDPDISVTSQYSELTGQMEPMAVFEAKVLTDRLRLQAATPFATTKGRRASAEMRISDHLSSQLSWQNEAVGYSSGDLGFDLKLRWEWE